ncbi:MAG TPA: glycosyltransferase family 4 protein [Longimicrobiaceae bacterium]|nr:glycosyltransferase family 4 protein [Longimicrobiaceae bacterium]
MNVRLAIVATHPIQYYAPLFRRLAERGVLNVHVFYGWAGASLDGVRDPGFGLSVRWDVPLLNGYEFTFVPNRSRDPGTQHFRGLDNPDLIPSLLAWQPDVVLVFGWAHRSHLRALRALHGRVPILFRGDSTLLDERPGVRRLARRAWLTWVYRHVDLALYAGQHNREYFLRHGLGEDQLAWVPHAVDNERFAASDEERREEAESWRAAEGIPKGATTVLYSGKLETVKAPGVLLRAFRTAAAGEDHLVFVGSGPLESALRAAAEGDPRIHFLGFQNQSRMPVVYRLGDIFVLPSRSETWGLAVNEAMACGRPVIVGDRVGCAPDLVHPGKNGLVVPANDPDALGAALRGLSDDPALRRAMGSASREIIRDWSIERAALSIEEQVYRSFSAPPARPRQLMSASSPPVGTGPC